MGFHLKQVFLVAILLTIVMGSHGRVCHTSKDCPTCKLGQGLCADGVCTCLDMNMIMQDDDVAIKKQGCKTDKDCGKLCPKGCSSYSCVSNICLCAC